MKKESAQTRASIYDAWSRVYPTLRRSGVKITREEFEGRKAEAVAARAGFYFACRVAISDAVIMAAMGRDRTTAYNLIKFTQSNRTPSESKAFDVGYTAGVMALMGNRDDKKGAIALQAASDMRSAMTVIRAYMSDRKTQSMASEEIMSTMQELASELLNIIEHGNKADTGFMLEQAEQELGGLWA